MRNLFIAMMALVAFVNFTSCDNDDVNIYIEDKEVSLNTVNLLATTKETLGAKGGEVQYADPYCSPAIEHWVDFTGNDNTPRATFIGRILNGEEVIGYKWRIRNPFNTPITNVKVGINGSTQIYSAAEFPARTELFIIVPTRDQGVAIKWDGGSKGTGSAGETQDKQACYELIPEVCDFPEQSYTHQIPSKFNVFFIPLDAQDKTPIVYTGVKEGITNFTIPAQRYDVVVTNYSEYNNLPTYSSDLYLYGTSEIDFSNLAVGTVEVSSPYSAVMVANTVDVQATPTLGGNELDEVSSDWFNIYSKFDGEETLLITGRDGVKTVVNEHDDNVVYKYLLCTDSDQGFTVDDNILNDEVEIIVK